jgi:hypothetical protein
LFQSAASHEQQLNEKDAEIQEQEQYVTKIYIYIKIIF